MKHKLILLTLLAAGIVDACTCMWAGPFLKVAPGAELIVRGKVLNYHGKSRGIDLAMDVRVVEILKGREGARVIRIWGDNGAQCRPYVTAFPVGTEWIFAVRRNSAGGKRGDYEISVCGEYWAKVEGSNATGRLISPTPPSANDKPEVMSLDRIRQALR